MSTPDLDLARRLLESAPDALVIADKTGTIVIVNTQTERIFGWTREQLVGQPVEVLVPDRFRSRHAGHRDGYLNQPNVRAMGSGLTLFGRRSDGSEFPVEISLSPIDTPNGLLVSAAIRDITDRLLTEERQNQEANRLKSEFLANMSHELRTPLNAIMGFTQILHTGLAGDVTATQKEYLHDILTSSEHLLRLINDVLDVAKVESGKLGFVPETTDVSSVLREVSDILRGMAAEKQVVVETICGDMPMCRLDPARLKQVLYNYLSNAIKFSRNGERVELRARRKSEDVLRIEVEDQGVGIRDGDRRKLFVAFQQLDASMTKEHAGTGLGLAVTKRIVEAQGGSVGVESTFGEGSLFWAELPFDTVDSD